MRVARPGAPTIPLTCSTSFVLDYEMFDEQSDRLIARGKTVQVMIDPKGGRARAIAPELRARLRSFAEHWGPVPE